QAYALLAFTQGAHGRPLNVNVEKTPACNFDAYAYRDTNNSVFVTLINKSYGSDAKTAAVSIQLPPGEKGKWHCHRMDLVQQNHDIAAKSGVMLGGAEIGPDGLWQGKWKNAGRTQKGSGMKVLVPPASATILHFTL